MHPDEIPALLYRSGRFEAGACAAYVETSNCSFCAKLYQTSAADSSPPKLGPRDLVPRSLPRGICLT